MTVKGELCPFAEAAQMTLEDEEIKYHAVAITDVDCIGWLASRSGHLYPGVYRLDC
jgi:hypothetical protein